jgi:hypothetical protein
MKTAVLALVVCLLPSLALAAPAVVIKSTVSGLAVGAMVEEDQVIDVPAGAAVTLVTPAGKTVTRSGPFNGAAIGTGGGGDASVARTISGFLSKKGGETRVGAVRAAASRTADDPDVIPVAASGRYCAPQGGSPLWRGASDTEETYTLREVASGSQGEVAFARGAETVAWPAAVPLRDGGTYLVRVKGSVRSSRIVLAVAPGPVDNPAVRVAWMIDKGCTRQADLLIERLAGG